MFISEPQEEEDTAIQNNDNNATDDEDVFTYAPLTEDRIVAYLEQYPEIVRPLLIGYVADAKGVKFDKSNVTGINYNIHTSKIILGNKEIKIISEGDIEVDGKRYRGTKGLYNLLFLKDPKTFNKGDGQLYVQLLLATDALYKNHKSNSQFQGVRSNKYTQIIKPILKNGGVVTTQLSFSIFSFPVGDIKIFAE